MGIGFHRAVSNLASVFSFQIRRRQPFGNLQIDGRFSVATAWCGQYIRQKPTSGGRNQSLPPPGGSLILGESYSMLVGHTCHPNGAALLLNVEFPVCQLRKPGLFAKNVKPLSMAHRNGALGADGIHALNGMWNWTLGIAKTFPNKPRQAIWKCGAN